MYITECTLGDETVNNKFHSIQPQLGLWPASYRIIRREENVLARIKIAHRHLTNFFLLKKKHPPQCIASDCHLTVTHIFLKCVSLIETN